MQTCKACSAKWVPLWGGKDILKSEENGLLNYCFIIFMHIQNELKICIFKETEVN